MGFKVKPIKNFTPKFISGDKTKIGRDWQWILTHTKSTCPLLSIIFVWFA